MEAHIPEHCSLVLPVFELYVSEIIYDASFCVWILLLNILFMTLV